MNLSNYGLTENIDVAPLINLEELKPSDDEAIENTENDKLGTENDLIQYKSETINKIHNSQKFTKDIEKIYIKMLKLVYS